MANDFNNKKYYWIKLKDNFMTSETVDFLMSQKNGANYVVLYQMLCLKTINTNGELARQIGEIIIPFDIEKITRDCKWFDIDTIRIALGLYQKLGLVYLQDNGILKISNFENLIGSETQSNLYKKQSKNELENFQPNSNKRLDIRDKIIENKRLDIREKSKNGEQVADTPIENAVKPLSEKEKLIVLLKASTFSEKLKAKIVDWLNYKKYQYKVTGFQSLLTIITKNAEQFGEQAIVDLIDESMANTYKGIIFDKLKKPTFEKSKQAAKINYDEE
ncbi:MAG: phage replisome organizer N-terminal domain-containing protein [Clostridia bacterium]